MHELADQLLSYLRAAWRYRWYAALAAWLIALGGWTAVHLMPDRYEAQARVFVDTQSMLRPLLSGIAVQPNIDQTVAMMSRTLVSRVNVEKVIRMADVGSGLQSGEEREQLISRLTQELAVKSAGRENLYTIAYSDRDRERAKRVVQSLLTIFMEGSAGSKRKDSDSAREFIEDQLRSYSEKLVAAENAMMAFKRKHQGLMPGDGRDFYGALSAARAALRQASLELREALNSRDAIKQQLAGEAQAAARPGDQVAAVQPPSELDLRIRALQQKLDALRLVYTEQHPDIVATTRIIAQLKEQREADEKVKQPAQDGGKPAPRAPQGPLYEQLMVSLAAAEANVAAMKARVAEYDVRYNELQATANAVPQVEAEYKQLTRDYEVIRSRYDKLLERRESAQISGDVEASDAAMGFQVIDPPRVPLEPSGPNRPRLMSMVLFAALGGGFGIAFVLSQLKTTFSDERRLREASGMRVLGTIAMAWNERQRKRRALGLFALALSFLGLVLVYGVVMASLMGIDLPGLLG
jgi:polysaccharide chain length determinant protein (PEP-CTERM system associated)